MDLYTFLFQIIHSPPPFHSTPWHWHRHSKPNPSPPSPFIYIAKQGHLDMPSYYKLQPRSVQTNTTYAGWLVLRHGKAKSMLAILEASLTEDHWCQNPLSDGVEICAAWLRDYHIAIADCRSFNLATVFQIRLSPNQLFKLNWPLLNPVSLALLS